MLEILPNTDWSHELIRPGLNLILRRLDRLFTKISKKSALRVRKNEEKNINIREELVTLHFRDCGIYISLSIGNHN